MDSNLNKRVAVLDELIKKQSKSINIYEEFTHIRGYHGCRPMSIDSYYKDGIKPINKKFAKQEALLRLCDQYITEERVIEVFNKSWTALQYPHKSVWFTYSENEFFNSCGHYLIYGSEFLCGMATELFCQPNLKRIGIPTIFYCDIPLDNIPKDYLSGINQQICMRDSTGGFRVYGEVLAQEIVGHTHPKTIYDPLIGLTYCYKT